MVNGLSEHIEIEKGLISICIPVWRSAIFPSFFKSFVEMEKPENYKYEHIIMGDLNIAHARNMCIKKARGEFLLFLDPDMVLHKDLLIKLLAICNDEHPVVSGLYYSRWPPYKVQAYTFSDDGWIPDWNHPIDKPFETQGIGMGCCLMKRDVCNKIDYPWFAFQHEGGTEDLPFCKKIIDAGYKIMIDPNVLCGHITDYIIKGPIMISTYNPRTDGEPFANLEFKDVSKLIGKETMGDTHSAEHEGELKKEKLGLNEDNK